MVNYMKVLLVSILLASVIGCNVSTQAQGEEKQEEIMSRALKAVPVPEVNNFLTRENVSKWMKRMDVPSKTFYIYVTTQMGDPIGYFVAQYKPVSTATFLTPTKKRAQGPNGAVTLPSPALDGTYYGEGAGVAQYFWFDAETDALIELSGFPYILSDQPLDLGVPRIKVKE